MASIHILHNSVSLAAESPSSFARKKKKEKAIK
jgi:hypothetical protein